MAEASAPARPAEGGTPEPSWREVLWARRGTATTVLAIVLWWFVGFEGTADWLELPLRVTEVDVVFLGALAASTAAGLLVPSPWPRFLVVAGFAGLGWLLTAPPEDPSVPYLRLGLATALVVGCLLGLALGSRAQAGTGPLATALAVLVPLCAVGWLQGPLLAVALALPFVHATRDRVAPTVLGVVRVVVVWLATAVLATALRYGWDTVRPAQGLTVSRVRENVTGAAGDLLRTSWIDIATQTVQMRSFWLWVGAALAVVVVTVRASRSVAASRAST